MALDLRKAPLRRFIRGTITAWTGHVDCGIDGNAVIMGRQAG
jgi:hypothetical protein